MVKSYWKHPLFKNPSKWLTIERSHASNLYQNNPTEYYDPKGLEGNPFALGLLQIVENTTTSATLNTLIPIEVQPNKADLDPQILQKDKKWYILPFIQPITEQISRRECLNSNIGHIPNNRQLVQNVIKKQSHRQYLPERFRFDSFNTSSLRKPIMTSGFSDSVQDELKYWINKLMANAQIEPVTDDESQINGLIIEYPVSKPNYITNIEYVNGKPHIQLGDLIDYPQNTSFFLPFTKNTDLCYFIISLCDYNQNTRIDR